MKWCVSVCLRTCACVSPSALKSPTVLIPNVRQLNLLFFLCFLLRTTNKKLFHQRFHFAAAPKLVSFVLGIKSKLSKYITRVFHKRIARFFFQIDFMTAVLMMRWNRYFYFALIQSVACLSACLSVARSVVWSADGSVACVFTCDRMKWKMTVSVSVRKWQTIRPR